MTTGDEQTMSTRRLESSGRQSRSRGDEGGLSESFESARGGGGGMRSTHHPARWAPLLRSSCFGAGSGCGAAGLAPAPARARRSRPSPRSCSARRSGLRVS
eukprot:2205074-Rhodomonas_salina.1